MSTPITVPFDLSGRQCPSLPSDAGSPVPCARTTASEGTFPSPRQYAIRDPSPSNRISPPAVAPAMSNARAVASPIAPVRPAALKRSTLSEYSASISVVRATAVPACVRARVTRRLVTIDAIRNDTRATQLPGASMVSVRRGGKKKKL